MTDEKELIGGHSLTVRILLPCSISRMRSIRTAGKGWDRRWNTSSSFSNPEKPLRIGMNGRPLRFILSFPSPVKEKADLFLRRGGSLDIFDSQIDRQGATQNKGDRDEPF